ncbi:MAG: hypothetical protein WD607_01060, partial [Candidatus Paceibacterota bacterium]
NLSLSLNPQPGIIYYPDKFSRDFADSDSDFKGHYGYIFHRFDYDHLYRDRASKFLGMSLRMI